MHIDGQCHCGGVTYQAEIDPERVSICHCTDCQTLTGSPYRVTVICSGEQIRMTGKPPRTYAKVGDNGRIRVQHFCPDCGSPLFTSGEGDASDDWGIRWGSIRQRGKLSAEAADLVPLGRAMDQRRFRRCPASRPSDVSTPVRAAHGLRGRASQR